MKKVGKIVLVILLLIVASIVFLWYANDCHIDWEASAGDAGGGHTESKAIRVFCGSAQDTSPTILTYSRLR